MKLTVLGAAGEVTGSQHLIETSTRRLLLDCGLFQGHRAESRAKNSHFHCQPQELDAVILSHAHIDHCGNLPGLYKAGFRGPIFCTPPTAEIAAVMLRDAAKIQAEDAEYLRRHMNPRDARAVEPLYTEEHASAVCDLFETIPYGQQEEVGKDVRILFREAGHILGSAIVELDLEEQGEWKRVVFTGDLGRRGLPILRDPQLVDRCDLLITEGTYGNRIHPEAGAQELELQRIIQRTAAREGRVIIPAFALGRTQNILYYLNDLNNQNLLPRIPMYVDSPLSRELTQIYLRHLNEMDAAVQRVRQADEHPFSFPGLQFIRTPQESASLNYRKGSFVVIASSGMCESGRVVHHLKHGLADEKNTVILMGFQAQGTLGRRLQERRSPVKVLNREVEIRADIECLTGLSAHADAVDFQWWFGELGKRGGCGKAVVVHSEEGPAAATASLLADVCDEPPIVPKPGEVIEF